MTWASALDRARTERAALRLFGLRGSVRFKLARRRGSGQVSLPIRAFGHVSVQIRPNDSDFHVARQIFVQRQYALPAELTFGLVTLAESWVAAGVRPVIVDGGANVGYSTLDLAARYPASTVVAVEPNSDSADLLRANTAGIPNVRVVSSALWEHDRGVRLMPGGNGSWSDQVDDDGRPGDVTSITLRQAVDLIPNGRALLVKLDIEGAERTVCAAALDLLREVPCVIIEPHDWMLPGAGCLVPLLEGLRGREVDVHVIGENLVFIDSALTSSAMLARRPAVRPEWGVGRDERAATSA